MARNQWSRGQVRRHRLPVVSVTQDERDRVEKYCSRTRISFADVVRAGLVALSILDPASLEDLPTAFAEHVKKMREGVH